jgi:sugar (pentulose or hexulose) kinase
LRPVCVLALDLGTSAFKCGAVSRGALLGEVVELPYALDERDGSVTVDPPERYALLAREALAAAARQARAAGAEVRAVGVCSQAQTFVTVDALGAPAGPALVWLDGGASPEAEELTPLAPDYAARTGFPKPSAQQFLPKVLRETRRADCSRRRFLLLNEFVILRLTGCAYGDTTQQGMGGFYDLSLRRWTDDYLRLAGIETSQLAPVYPAARFAWALSPGLAGELGVTAVPVYSCGNDQCCSAIGAGLTGPDGEGKGTAVCNFGTAMVVYTVTSGQRRELRENQIAGIEPLSGGYFLLGYESECGNLMERALREHFSGGSMDGMIRAGGSGVRALLERLSEAFGELLSGLEISPGRSPLIATGGLSRSAAWLDFLEKAHGVQFRKAAHEHASLLGIAEVISKQAGGGA